MKLSAHPPASRSLGLLILGRKRPGFDQEWNRTICDRSLGALQSLGYNCVGAEAPVVDDASIRVALDRIRQQECEVLVMLQPSMGHGQMALTVAQNWPDPVVLWATPERPGDGKVSSCSLVGQHLWASALRQARHPFELVYGDPDAPALREDLSLAIALARSVRRLRRAKVGVIGTHAPGFIDLAVEPFLLRQTLGIQLAPLSLPQFIERVQAIPDEAVQSDLRKVLEMQLPMEGVSEDDLAVNSRFYIAMSEWMHEEGLDALSIQCWPELPNMLGQWPYLAVSRLGTQGRAISIEGDVDGAIGSLIHCHLGAGPGFLTDWLEHDDDSIFFWHPGMAPMDMCEGHGCEGAPSLAIHFNIPKPLVVNGRIRSGEAVTVSRLWRCDGRYHLTAFEGKSIDPARRLTGNTVRVRVSGERVPARFDRLIHAGMPHHVLLSFGSHAGALRRLARMLDLNWVG
jgi:L-fucose isomerase-like protein